MVGSIATPSSDAEGMLVGPVAVADAGLKSYQELKESGVSWLGKVPAHWEVRHLWRKRGVRGPRRRSDVFERDRQPLSPVSFVEFRLRHQQRPRSHASFFGSSSRFCLYSWILLSEMDEFARTTCTT